MSIHKIPNSFLNTTINIFRNTGTLDSVGDQTLSKETAYYAVKANIQPQTSDVEYNLQGEIHLQTHSCYINKVEDSISRTIEPGDIVLDEETGLSHIVLGIKILQAARRSITDSHHIKLILKTMTGKYDITELETIIAKAKII